MESEETNDQGNKFILKLYVAGMAISSMKAIDNLSQLREKYHESIAEIKIIDIHQFPELALSEQIIATPTLIRVSPLPIKRLLGDLSDKSKVILTLGLK